MEGGGGSNNQGPAQGAAANVNVAPAAAAAGDWRVQLPPGARDRIVNKILDTLQRHLPICEKEGLDELRRIAERFEEKIYNIAGNQVLSNL
ncbi:hypothetical protein Taro_029459 [Colocasia esculenta]|uniref:Mediator complex subunit 15 KIX domain-containing protein n=1 Tax=Colocasia esculenta TaxID=4460 RepID=A0A843VDU9_COLES|nr:hypothetical protein [Colocasia esculenta]